MNAKKLIDSNDKPIQVLQLAESPYVGGITSHILTIMEAFRDDKTFNIHVATIEGRRTDTTLLDQAQATGIDVDVLSMGNTYDLRVLRQIRSCIKKHKIDLVHTHNYRATILALLASGKCPVIATVHTAMPAKGYRMRFWQWLEMQCLKRMPQVIAVSHAVHNWLLSKGIHAENIRVCHNACPKPPANLTEVNTLRGKLGIPLEVIVIAYVGRLTEGKGLEILLDAISGLPVHLLLVGDGPLRSGLQLKSRELNLNVHFTGNVTNPFSLYALSDIVVLPSEMEALPMSLIEAAALGKPVVATNVGGIPEIITDGDNGLLIPYGDTQALRNALYRMLDATTREMIGQAAYRRWEKCFTPEHMKIRLERSFIERLTT